MSILNKKDFCNVIQKLQRNDEFIDRLYGLFREFDKEVDVYETGLEETLIFLLEKMFDDEGEWISYWIWETNYGKDYKDGNITEADGTVIPLKTAEELYDFLIKNIKQKAGG